MNFVSLSFQWFCFCNKKYIHDKSTISHFLSLSHPPPHIRAHIHAYIPTRAHTHTHAQEEILIREACDSPYGHIQNFFVRYFHENEVRTMRVCIIPMSLRIGFKNMYQSQMITMTVNYYGLILTYFNSLMQEMLHAVAVSFSYWK